MPGRRVIAHLDCDAFYVSVELLRRPELRGKPVVVAGSGPRAVVTTASYEARTFGVGSASPAAQARRLCPQAVFIPPDFAAYRATSREVWALVRRAPARRAAGRARRGLRRRDRRAAKPLPRPARAGRRGGATARASRSPSASGPNRLIAKVASDLEKPRGFVAMGREEACRRLADRSPRIIPGIGPKTAERLAALGFTTIGALQRADGGRCSRSASARTTAATCIARAHFHGSSVVEAESGPAKSRSNETTFDRDIADLAELEAVLARLAGELAEGLRRKDVRGADDRDQGPARRLDHGHPRPHAARRRRRRRRR